MLEHSLTIDGDGNVRLFDSAAVLEHSLAIDGDGNVRLFGTVRFVGMLRDLEKPLVPRRSGVSESTGSTSLRLCRRKDNRSSECICGDEMRARLVRV